jgi:hypothetical protein
MPALQFSRTPARSCRRRRDRVRILDCYLQRNMMRNGGLLVYVVFVTATWQPEDVEFLDRLIAKRAGDYR